MLHRYELKELEPRFFPEVESALSTIRERMNSGEGNNEPHRFDPNRKSQLVLLLSEACNLGCSYCFMTETIQHKAYMSEQTAIDAVKSYPARKICFFGGEPLMRFGVIKAVVAFANDYYVNELGAKPPWYILITNGTLLNNQIARFLRENHFAVTVSIDGPKDVTDIQRPTLSGHSTYDQILDGIACLRKAGVTFILEGTYTSNHVRLGYSVRDVVDHLLQLGTSMVHVEPVFGQSADGFSGLYLLSRNQLDGVVGEFKELAALSVESMATDRPLRIYAAYSAIKAVLYGRSSTTACNGGIDKITVDAEGRAYPCYLLMQRDLYMGNVNDDVFADAPPFYNTQKRMLGHSRKLIMPCPDCWARNFCSPCYGLEHASPKTLFGMNPVPYAYCALTRGVLESTISKLWEIRRQPRKWTKLLNALDEDVRLNHH